MKIPFCDLATQQNLIKNKIDERIQKVLAHGRYIMGPEIKELEDQLSAFTQTKHCITTSSGTDALILPMLAWDIQPGDEIITTPFSFIATIEVIALLKAKPVFVDIDPHTFNLDINQIENKISNKTKLIIPVSLFGLTPDLNALQDICNKHNLKLLEDGCQSFGASLNDKKSGSFGDAGATSFFPAKPLGCYGDGGAVFTNDDDLAEKIKQLRVHGQSKQYIYSSIGINGRLDTLQAAILLEKLSLFENELKLRNQVAKRYSDALSNIKEVICPTIPNGYQSAFAQYSLLVEKRDQLKEYLAKNDIPTAIYYPTSLHQQTPYLKLIDDDTDYENTTSVCKRIISLPMSAYTNASDQEYINQTIIDFYK
ncbi:MAG: aminotransferase DegT [Planctomycetota bacterium]|nr:MAG: aminotransferase DegT [Planctomycetota bacterium]